MKAVQHPLCLLLLGPVYWIIHQYNRCIFFLSPHLCLIWSENLLMQCVPGSCETNLELLIKIWCPLCSKTRIKKGHDALFVRDPSLVTMYSRKSQQGTTAAGSSTGERVPSDPPQWLWIMFIKCLWFKGGCICTTCHHHIINTARFLWMKQAPHMPQI